MLHIHELRAPGGRSLRVYDTAPSGGRSGTVVWHHGTPNLGPPPEPLLERSAELGLRWIGYDRAGYGGSERLPGRDIAQAARDVAWIAEKLDISNLAVMGHSGGGPHALACAALLPQIRAAVSISGLAPYGRAGLDYFAGMYPGGRAELEAATQGETALAGVLESGAYDPEMFTPADHAALASSWSWFHCVTGPALEHGPGGMIDDDLAYVSPWGFTPEQIQQPVLLLHGEDDRIVPVAHAEWLRRIPQAELRCVPGGHLSVMIHAAEALDWLYGHLSAQYARN